MWFFFLFLMFGLTILKALYLFLPAYFANMAPVLLKKVPFLGKPIHEKWFGAHKTWRGVLAAVLMGLIIFAIQKAGYNAGFTELAVIDYSDFSVAFGMLLGFGAIFGDLIESFLKRRAGIPPGRRWFPWDQIDFVIGGLLFMLFIYVPPVEVAAIILIGSPLLHIIVNHLGYYLRIQKSKW